MKDEISRAWAHFGSRAHWAWAQAHFRQLGLGPDPFKLIWVQFGFSSFLILRTIRNEGGQKCILKHGNQNN